MIIPLNIDVERDFQLLVWLNEESKKRGISRSAYMRYLLNCKRLGIDDDVKVIEKIQEIKKENKNSFAQGFINKTKK